MFAFFSLVAGASAAAFIDSGTIVGTTTKVEIPSDTATVNKYLGIPFANKPERFRLPEPVSPWSEPFDASQYRPACYQAISETTQAYYDGVGLGELPVEENEDCLNLNVFTPSAASAGSKPVLVWIYGGSWQDGANSYPMYDGSNIVANQDVVFVSFNYRTNVFGFPADESIAVSERNLGLHDARLALDWVQRNIASLGGDPFKVTLVGESAGSWIIDTLLTTPSITPLPFRAAIMASGLLSVTATPLNPPAYKEAWTTLAGLAGCSPDPAFTCLQAYPAKELQSLIIQNNLTFSGHPDNGTTISPTPRLNRLAGQTARVPILIGTNHDEATPFTIGLNNTRVALRSLGLANSTTNQLLSAYPLDPGTPGLQAENARITRILTEALMQCPSHIFANDTRSLNIPVYRFLFNASFPNTEFFAGAGAYHGIEVPFFFGTYMRENATVFQGVVSRVVQSAYADFARDPVAGPGWGEFPVVGVFGGGVTPYNDDKGRRPLSTVDAGVFDRRCGLYYGVYDANTGGINGMV
ncbi:Alpha/Beta hydrolase protein [Aspergillus recurvatus]